MTWLYIGIAAAILVAVLAIVVLAVQAWRVLRARARQKRDERKARVVELSLRHGIRWCAEPGLSYEHSAGHGPVTYLIRLAHVLQGSGWEACLGSMYACRCGHWWAAPTSHKHRHFVSEGAARDYVIESAAAWLEEIK